MKGQIKYQQTYGCRDPFSNHIRFLHENLYVRAKANGPFEISDERKTNVQYIFSVNEIKSELPLLVLELLQSRHNHRFVSSLFLPYHKNECRHFLVSLDGFCCHGDALRCLKVLHRTFPKILAKPGRLIFALHLRNSQDGIHWNLPRNKNQKYEW